MMATKKTAKIRITMTPQGGVNYAPTPGEPPVILGHGETHEVDQDFARLLIHQKRAVLADPTATLDTPALTTDMLAQDPAAVTQPSPARRARA